VEAPLLLGYLGFATKGGRIYEVPDVQQTKKKAKKRKRKKRLPPQSEIGIGEGEVSE
jgi:hypothetical protein